MPSPNYLNMFGFGSGIPYGAQGPGAPTATPGNLQGAPGTTGSNTPYGRVPQVPDPFTTQLNDIQGNLNNLGGLGNLSTATNTLIANNAALPYQLNLPNYGAMTGQSSGNILSLLQGQVPQDVANQIAQMGAERGVATGSIGSPNANTALLRSLGLTSLGLQGQGEQELTGAVGRTPTGQQFNPASFLNTPQQQQEMAYLANLLSAAPDPTLAANANLLNTLGGLGAGLGSGRRSTNVGGYYPGNISSGMPLGPYYSPGQQPLGGGPGYGFGDYGTTPQGGIFDPYGGQELLATSSSSPYPGLPQDMPPAGPMGFDQSYGDPFWEGP